MLKSTLLPLFCMIMIVFQAASFMLPPRFSSSRAQKFRRSLIVQAEFDPRVSPHSYGKKEKQDDLIGVIIIDHGSKRNSANRQLDDLVLAVKDRTGRNIVEAAHMELCAPTLREAYASCVEQGARRIVCHPFFLSPGRHVTEDIPSLLADAALSFPEVPYVLTMPLGANQAIPKLIADSIEETLRFYPSEKEDTGEEGLLMEILRMTQEQIDIDETASVGDENKSASEKRPPSIEELASPSSEV